MDQMEREDAKVADPIVKKLDDDQKHAILSAQPSLRGMELPENPLVEMELVDLGIAYPALKMKGIRAQATLNTKGQKVRRYLMRGMS